jgi:hypothetical protein
MANMLHRVHHARTATLRNPKSHQHSRPEDIATLMSAIEHNTILCGTSFYCSSVRPLLAGLLDKITEQKCRTVCVFHRLQ